VNCELDQPERPDLLQAAKPLLNRLIACAEAGSLPQHGDCILQWWLNHWRNTAVQIKIL